MILSDFAVAMPSVGACISQAKATSNVDHNLKNVWKS
jgi:hypothetical protein